jgi:hypothetical protein
MSCKTGSMIDLDENEKINLLELVRTGTHADLF